jgi:signal transduction histidine kinase
VDAVDELRIPDRALFLLDSAAHPIKPATVDSFVATAAAEALHGEIRKDAGGSRPLRLFARSFTTASGTHYVAVATADRAELEDEYAALIAAFAGAALAALLLVAGGGYLLVRQATAPIERNMEYMRRFMADAAHELRTPLTVLRTRAEVILQRSREAGEYVVALEAIEREAQRLGGIVEDLLLLARVDAGERALRRSRVYLDDLVLDVAGGAGMVAERRGIKLDVQRAEEAEVEGDPALLRQLISIVLDNAVKFTPAGGNIQVGVSAVQGAATVTVEDSGPGISPEQMPHIFERFYRGDPARSRSDGAGLGLAIARWIADAHGADIDVQSAVGKGTRVGLRFPPPLSSS